MGRKILAAVTLFVLVPICYGQEKDPDEKIKLSVIEFLKKGEGSPAGCDLFKGFLAKDPLNVGKRKMMVGFCDSDINFSKPVSFSEMHTYQFEGHSYVVSFQEKQSLTRKSVFDLFQQSHIIWY
ncbi:TPA: hypothetical protein U5E37_002213 [Yersinia enterocolitica]|uniref:hypothetical protein n=1 Tax=Yersinia enterocolitica TaxID=630 RepID=UPI00094BA23D|nr:hypothetical protein [Yersinia enterocolitica]HEI6852616.1 hypothetical protein [Yersinia enterocolitica]HEN3605340.1 hypothetical protein [Yersinia enterocolitica]HEN3613042.1 hypothetical protein [Yersinia enterocolitica]HEN3654268.1 hypothetical protein [Yersinia enterocolitica]